MKAKPILNNSLEFVTENLHLTRKKAVFACVSSLVQGAQATVTAIGRDIHSTAHEKHNIKRADRLLSNKKLSADALGIYQRMARLLISPNSKPIVLIDWSDLDESKRNFLIRASLVTDTKRGIPVYEEVHGIGTKEKPATHQIFLKNLAQVLPQCCKPVLVTDAGFQVPWFKQVKALGWHFVGRTRLPCMYSKDKTQWHCLTNLYEQATNRAKTMSGYLTKLHEFPVNMAIYKGKPKGRKDINRYGEPRRSKKSRKHAKGAHDAWVISTSLTMKDNLGKKLVGLYKNRMQIEEGFRDMKCARTGQSMSLHGSYKTQRIANLVLLTTLANWVRYIAGTIALSLSIQKRYQANTVKNRTVLSVIFLGKRLLKDRNINITKRHLNEALTCIPIELNRLMKNLL